MCDMIWNHIPKQIYFELPKIGKSLLYALIIFPLLYYNVYSLECKYGKNIKYEVHFYLRHRE